MDTSNRAWRPTHDEFKRYLDREVEMAVEKVRKGERRTLHSDETIARANQIVNESRGFSL